MVRLQDEEKVRKDEHTGAYIAEVHMCDYYNGTSGWYTIGTFGSLKEAVKALIRSRS